MSLCRTGSSCHHHALLSSIFEYLFFVLELGEIPMHTSTFDVETFPSALDFHAMLIFSGSTWSAKSMAMLASLASDALTFTTVPKQDIPRKNPPFRTQSDVEILLQDLPVQHVINTDAGHVHSQRC